MYKVKVGEGLSCDKLRINVDNVNLKLTSQRKVKRITFILETLSAWLYLVFLYAIVPTCEKKLSKQVLLDALLDILTR